MIHFSLTASCRLGIAGLALALAGGCSSLHPLATPQPSFYALQSLHSETSVAAPTAAKLPGAAPTLIVNPPHAASGFDSQRIIYVRAAHQLEYFAHSEWVDTPARMLAPLIVSAVETHNAFRAVVLMPSAAAGDLMLDTEIIRLQQDFSSPPSQVRFTLRAYIEDNSTRRVLAWREFDATVAATSEDPYGGVVAANHAVQSVLKQLADFCVATAANRQALAPPDSAP
ncbi:MAG: ABC-type transport auxiliary lipoprotein family protein [Gallionellaceae bacterium]|nr:ABC-type transport auxiliary lipoprotein family protein [Gallionellaceae bacterium]